MGKDYLPPNHPNELLFMKCLSYIMPPLTDLWGLRGTPANYPTLLFHLMLMPSKSPAPVIFQIHSLVLPRLPTFSSAGNDGITVRASQLVSLPSLIIHALFPCQRISPKLMADLCSEFFSDFLNNTLNPLYNI